MPANVTQQLIASHLVADEGAPSANERGSCPPTGSPLALRVDQTLTQDATGTLVMLALEAIDLRRVQTELSVQYVDHNLIQEDHKNADDHLFLESACRRYGLLFCPPGTGVSHAVHMQAFGRPGKTLLGSDSHTCAGGALGMLAIGAGGLEVAMAMAGEPLHLRMPEIWGVQLTGALPPWVSAKDVILEMLRRHGVSGGLGRIIEYHGPGVASLSIWDRHVIANMGAELGATSTVFPSDQRTRAFLAAAGRDSHFHELTADSGATYDITDHIELSALEPLIAKPSSPGNVVPVREVAGAPIYQGYLGSSANPAYRDYAVAALMVRERNAAPGVSFDVNPASRSVLLQLMREGLLSELVGAGARLHQVGCNGCIGMGQAPASGRNSVRTVPRNFPGRSGTPEDSVWLASPETVTASVLCGVITDPRSLPMPCPNVEEPRHVSLKEALVREPPAPDEARTQELFKGPNIASIPELAPLPDYMELPILLKTHDDISTDEILPAGARVLPFRSNIPEIARFAFEACDPSYPRRARPDGQARAHAIVGGRNYGQGSSREHAALAPRYLGLRAVLALSFARIHRDNLVNFGVLPLTFVDAQDAELLARDDVLLLSGLHRALASGPELSVTCTGEVSRTIRVRHDLSSREVAVAREGGLISWVRRFGRAAGRIAADDA
jgi:aconitate hydratase